MWNAVGIHRNALLFYRFAEGLHGTHPERMRHLCVSKDTDLQKGFWDTAIYIYIERERVRERVSEGVRERESERESE